MVAVLSSPFNGVILSMVIDGWMILTSEESILNWELGDIRVICAYDVRRFPRGEELQLVFVDILDT